MPRHPTRKGGLPPPTPTPGSPGATNPKASSIGLLQPQSESSSSSLRSAALSSSESQSNPSSQPTPQLTTPSRPSQLGTHSFTPYRHPQPTANSGAPRSQGGPNGTPPQMNAGMSSPQLSPTPHNGQPSGMPPPPQMQPQMAQQMPVPWSYYPYPDPIHQQHAPPPMSHPSTSISSISSPPPTLSTTTSRLNVNSTAFVPPRPRVTLRKADGTEVNIGNLKLSSSPANNSSTNGQASVFRQGSPETNNPNRRSVRLETPEQRDKRIAEEERVKAQSEEKAKKEKEAQEHKQKELEEQKKREEEEKRRREPRSPAHPARRRRQAPNGSGPRLPTPLPSALATARIIDDLSRVQYPEGISGPNPALNANVRDGKFRYDRDFLLQFMAICKEKPGMLPPLDAIGIEPIDQSSLAMARGGSGRHYQASGSMPQHQGSIGMGFNEPSTFSKPTALNPFGSGGRGQLATSGAKLTSEEGFQLRKKEGEAQEYKQEELEEHKQKELSLSARIQWNNKKRPGRLDHSNISQASAPLPSTLATAHTIDDLSRFQYPEDISNSNPTLNANPKDGKLWDQASNPMPSRHDVSNINKDPSHSFLSQIPLSMSTHNLPHDPHLRPAPVILNLSHIPLLTGRADFNDWDCGMRGVLATMGLLDHIYDPSFGFVVPEGFVVTRRPDTMYDPTPHDTVASMIWWRDDQITAHILRNRLSPDITAFPLGVMDAKGLYAEIYRTYSTRDWHTGKALWDETVRLHFDSRQLFDYCKRWRSAFMQIHNTRYPLPVTMAIDYFLQQIPDVATPILTIKSNFYNTVHAINENDPQGFLRVIESVEACANDLRDPLPAIPAVGDPPCIPSQITVPVARTATLTNSTNTPALTFCEVHQDSPEMVDRKVRSLLNKLTMKRFDSISDQIIEWANKSEKEKDGRTLIQVIRLVFERAVNEAMWSEMYARLCRKMMKQISDKVQHEGIRDAEGKPIAGGQLFRKYLLNRCQDELEMGWVTKEAIVAATAFKAVEGEAAKASDKNNKKGGGTRGVILYSDEYYAAQKARRQGVGLVKFIGELFKVRMLTERIMHECIQKFLVNVNNPEEEEIESLCMLLTTVGSLLDTQNARAHMDVYFQRMRELTKSPDVSPWMQTMLQDVIELRDRNWVARNAVAASATITQIREAAVKEKAANEEEHSQRQVSLTPVAGNTARRPSKISDLSNFGKIKKAPPIKFRQSSIFDGKKASTLLVPTEMSEDAAKKKIDEDSKELFGVRNLDEAEVYFTALPIQYHHKLIDKLVSTAVESREADTQLVSDLFTRAASKNLCSPSTFEEGLTPVAEIIDDIAIDVPKAFTLFATMVKGVGFDEDRRSRLASKSMDSDKLLALLSEDHPPLN